jgi:hypothetical protein
MGENRYRDEIRAQNYTVYALEQALSLIDPVRPCEIGLPGTGAMVKHLTGKYLRTER